MHRNGSTMRRIDVMCGVVATLVFLAAVGCAGRPEVVRVVDGRETPGRYVHPEAYARFLTGVVAEERGQLRVAEQAYASALQFDRRAVAILARLGAVVCAQPGGEQRARGIFGEALSRDDRYAPSYLERGKCAERAGDQAAAERDAREAMRVEPYDPDVTLLMSRVLEASGRGEQAAQYLDGYVQRFPEAVAMWGAALALAERRGDRVRAAQARGMLERTRDEAEARARPSLTEQVDDALLRGDLEAAREHAVASSMGASEVAVRAAGLGCWALALEQAQLVLSADPGNPDAVAVWYASPEPSAKEGRLEPSIESRILEEQRTPSKRRLSVLGALVLANGLRRRIGMDAANAFLSAYGPVDPRDALAAALLRRLGEGLPRRADSRNSSDSAAQSIAR